VAHRPDIRGVVGARCGRDDGIFEQAFFDGQLLVDIGGHEHDVYQTLVHDLRKR
jgi:hypothetical protein